MFFFFFSSRRRHTRYIGDWSSDVCSSDLVDARLGHAACDFAELTRLLLVQPLDKHVSLFQHADACRFERAAGGGPVFEQEMRYTLAVNHERAPTLDAHSGVAQSIAHLGERAGPVLKRDGEVFHGSILYIC